MYNKDLITMLGKHTNNQSQISNNSIKKDHTISFSVNERSKNQSQKSSLRSLSSQNRSDQNNKDQARDESRRRKKEERDKFNKLMAFINENNKML